MSRMRAEMSCSWHHRDQAMAVDEVQGHRAASATCMGCQQIRKNVSEGGLEHTFTGDFPGSG